MNKYQRLKQEIETIGTGKMKVFGNSMLPMIQSGSTLTFEPCPDPRIGDVVCCKVRGRYIDAHKITKIDPNKGYMIANNHGYENGWTRTIYARAVSAEYQGTITNLKKI